MAFKLSSPLAMNIGKPSNMVESNKPKPTVKKETPKDKIKAGRALKKEGRKEKRSERKDARLERRIVRATKKGKAALESGKVGKGSKSLEMRRKVDRLKAKKTKAVKPSSNPGNSAMMKKGDPSPTPKPKPKVTGKKFPGYYNVPNAKPYKRNSDGSVQMVTTKGSTYSLRRGTDT